VDRTLVLVDAAMTDEPLDERMVNAVAEAVMGKLDRQISRMVLLLFAIALFAAGLFVGMIIVAVRGGL